MHTVQTKRRSKRSGVTLLEAMVVLAIMALIVGLAAPRVLGSFDRARSQAAEVQMANIEGALRLFFLDVGRYPTTAEGLSALHTAPAGLQNWRGPYIEDANSLDDPWGRPFLYEGNAGSGAVELKTYGADGLPGGTRSDSDIVL